VCPCMHIYACLMIPCVDLRLSQMAATSSRQADLEHLPADKVPEGQGAFSPSSDTSSLRFFRPGARVWIRNPYRQGDERYRASWMPDSLSGRPLWVPAEVRNLPTDQEGAGKSLISVQTSLPPRAPLMVAASQVLPMNSVTSLADACDFGHLHDAALLYSTLRRFVEERPFTRAGSTMLSVNPLSHLADADGVAILDPLYAERFVSAPSKSAIDALPPSKARALRNPPHVFEVAESLIRQTAHNRCNVSQVLVPMGLSRSGKSEALKHIAQYLLSRPTHLASVDARHRLKHIPPGKDDRPSLERLHALDPSTINPLAPAPSPPRSKSVRPPSNTSRRSTSMRGSLPPHANEIAAAARDCAHRVVTMAASTARVTAADDDDADLAGPPLPLPLGSQGNPYHHSSPLGQAVLSSLAVLDAFEGARSLHPVHAITGAGTSRALRVLRVFHAPARVLGLVSHSDPQAVAAVAHGHLPEVPSPVRPTTAPSIAADEAMWPPTWDAELGWTVIPVGARIESVLLDRSPAIAGAIGTVSGPPNVTATTPVRVCARPSFTVLHRLVEGAGAELRARLSLDVHAHDASKPGALPFLPPPAIAAAHDAAKGKMLVLPGCGFRYLTPLVSDGRPWTAEAWEVATRVPAEDDEAEFASLASHLTDGARLSSDDVSSVWSMLAGLLHLGNVRFREVVENEGASELVVDTPPVRREAYPGGPKVEASLTGTATDTTTIDYGHRHFLSLPEAERSASTTSGRALKAAAACLGVSVESLSTTILSIARGEPSDESSAVPSLRPSSSTPSEVPNGLEGLVPAGAGEVCRSAGLSAYALVESTAPPQKDRFWYSAALDAAVAGAYEAVHAWVVRSCNDGVSIASGALGVRARDAGLIRRGRAPVDDAVSLDLRSVGPEIPDAVSSESLEAAGLSAIVLVDAPGMEGFALSRAGETDGEWNEAPTSTADQDPPVSIVGPSPAAVGRLLSNLTSERLVAGFHNATFRSEESFFRTECIEHPTPAPAVNDGPLELGDGRRGGLLPLAEESLRRAAAMRGRSTITRQPSSRGGGFGGSLEESLSVPSPSVGCVAYSGTVEERSVADRFTSMAKRFSSAVIANDGLSVTSPSGSFFPPHRFPSTNGEREAAARSAKGKADATALTITPQFHAGIRHTGAATVYDVRGMLGVLACGHSERLLLGLLAATSGVAVVSAACAQMIRSHDKEEGENPLLVAAGLSAPSEGRKPIQPRGPPLPILSVRVNEAVTSILEPLLDLQPHAAGDESVALPASVQPTFMMMVLPNALLRAGYVDPLLVHKQLASMALLQTVALRHSGFSQRLSYEQFFARFVFLVPPGSGNDLHFPPPPGAPMRQLCRRLLGQLLRHPVFEGVDVQWSAQFGVSRLFIKRQLWDTLETLREHRLQLMDRLAENLQALWRVHQARKRRTRMKVGMSRLQGQWRCLLLRSLWARRRWCALRIQHAWRGHRIYRVFVHMRRAVVRIQSWGRSIIARQRMDRYRVALVRLHTLCRGFIVRTHITAMLRCQVRIQAVARGFLARRRMRRFIHRCATVIQAGWRGYLIRCDRLDVREFLLLARVQRGMHRAAARIQAAFRASLVRNRAAQLRTAATAIQQWWRSRLQRKWFHVVQGASRVLGLAARRFLAKRQGQQLRTQMQVADALWQRQVVREREAVALALVTADGAVMRRARLLAATSSDVGRRGLLDVGHSTLQAEGGSLSRVGAGSATTGGGLSFAASKAGRVEVDRFSAPLRRSGGPTSSSTFAPGGGGSNPLAAPGKAGVSPRAAMGVLVSEVLSSYSLPLNVGRSLSPPSDALSPAVERRSPSPPPARRSPAKPLGLQVLKAQAATNAAISSAAVSLLERQLGGGALDSPSRRRRSPRREMRLEEVNDAAATGDVLMTLPLDVQLIGDVGPLASGGPYPQGWVASLECLSRRLDSGMSVALDHLLPAPRSVALTRSADAGSSWTDILRVSSPRRATRVQREGGRVTVVSPAGAPPLCPLRSWDLLSRSEGHASLDDVCVRSLTSDEAAQLKAIGVGGAIPRLSSASPNGLLGRASGLAAILESTYGPTLAKALGSGRRERVEIVAVGSTHTLALTDAGRVFSWGASDRGQCGHGGTDTEDAPRLVEGLLLEPATNDAPPARTATPMTNILSSVRDPSRARVTRPPFSVEGGAPLRVVSVVSGHDHNLALSDQGLVFAWGCSRHGQLGIGVWTQATCPVLVEGLPRVTMIAAGARHSVALSTTGSVFTWGAGECLGRTTTRTSRASVGAREPVVAGAWDSCRPGPVGGELSRHRVRHVSCGSEFTAVTTHAGDVLTWGRGLRGQLGLGVAATVSACLTPRIVSDSLRPGMDRHSRIAMCVCGVEHCVALSSTGQVFSWGANSHGQLGLGDTRDRPAPVHLKVLAQRRAVSVAAGAISTYILTDYGEVACWGGSQALRPWTLPAVEGVDSDRGETLVAHTHFASSLPVDVSLTSTPGRAPRRIVTAFSRSLTVALAVVSQSPLPLEVSLEQRKERRRKAAEAALSRARRHRILAAGLRGKPSPFQDPLQPPRMEVEDIVIQAAADAPDGLKTITPVHSPRAALEEVARSRPGAGELASLWELRFPDPPKPSPPKDQHSPSRGEEQLMVGVVSAGAQPVSPEHGMGALLQRAGAAFTGPRQVESRSESLVPVGPSVPASPTPSVVEEAGNALPQRHRRRSLPAQTLDLTARPSSYRTWLHPRAAGALLQLPLAQLQEMDATAFRTLAERLDALARLSSSHQDPAPLGTMQAAASAGASDAGIVYDPMAELEALERLLPPAAPAGGGRRRSITSLQLLQELGPSPSKGGLKGHIADLVREAQKAAAVAATAVDSATLRETEVEAPAKASPASLAKPKGKPSPSADVDLRKALSPFSFREAETAATGEASQAYHRSPRGRPKSEAKRKEGDLVLEVDSKGAASLVEARPLNPGDVIVRDAGSQALAASLGVAVDPPPPPRTDPPPPERRAPPPLPLERPRVAPSPPKGPVNVDQLFSPSSVLQAARASPVRKPTAHASRSSPVSTRTPLPSNGGEPPSVKALMAHTASTAAIAQAQAEHIGATGPDAVAWSLFKAREQQEAARTPSSLQHALAATGMTPIRRAKAPPPPADEPAPEEADTGAVADDGMVSDAMERLRAEALRVQSNLEHE
jgi:alpha-tubulin suppressor-like RCC1 family protein